MAGETPFTLQAEEQVALSALAAQAQDVEAQRAQALLLLADGRSQAEAAQESGLSASQVRYIANKFEEKRLLAFPGALGFLPADPISTPRAPHTPPSEIGPGTQRRLDRAMNQVDGLIRELRAALPEATEGGYSQARMLALVRDSAARYTPEVQLRMLEPFEQMTQEDLLDIETWKGIAYMIGYSAQFQATKTRDQLNTSLPEPVKPDALSRSLRGGLERLTPQMVKDLAANLEGATREDLLDPDTWRGLAYIVAYSAQFQANQARDTLNQQMPEPLKPDTILDLFQTSYNRFAPEVAKQIVAMFEDATLNDLLDPETWKGVWYLLNYSLQFQAEQMKHRLLAQESAGETAAE